MYYLTNNVSVFLLVPCQIAHYLTSVSKTEERQPGAHVIKQFTPIVGLNGTCKLSIKRSLTMRNKDTGWLMN